MLCQLTQGSQPSMTFLFVGSSVCRWLPSDLPSRKRLCLKLGVAATRIFWDHLGAGSPPGDFHPISSRPCWAYTTVLHRNILVNGWSCKGYLHPVSANVGLLELSVGKLVEFIGGIEFECRCIERSGCQSTVLNQRVEQDDQ